MIAGLDAYKNCIFTIWNDIMLVRISKDDPEKHSNVLFGLNSQYLSFRLINRLAIHESL